MSRTTLKYDHPLEQAGVAYSHPAAHTSAQHAANHVANHSGDHSAADLHISVLGHPTLLRMHSLLAVAELDAALAAHRWQLPGKVNECAGTDPSVLCLAPGDWLWFSEYLAPEVLRQQLRLPLQAVQDQRLTTLLDQSAAFAVFRLGGEAAPWLLSKCCGLDFRTACRQGRHCSRTRLNQAPAILHYHRPGNGSGQFVFDVMVERSLARYSWQLFQRQSPHARELGKQYGPLA